MLRTYKTQREKTKQKTRKENEEQQKIWKTQNEAISKISSCHSNKYPKSFCENNQRVVDEINCADFNNYHYGVDKNISWHHPNIDRHCNTPKQNLKQLKTVEKSKKEKPRFINVGDSENENSAINENKTDYSKQKEFKTCLKKIKTDSGEEYDSDEDGTPEHYKKFLEGNHNECANIMMTLYPDQESYKTIDENFAKKISCENAKRAGVILDDCEDIKQGGKLRVSKARRRSKKKSNKKIKKIENQIRK